MVLRSNPGQLPARPVQSLRPQESELLSKGPKLLRTGLLQEPGSVPSPQFGDVTEEKEKWRVLA